MKNVYLEENFYVESYAGMTDAWFDDVSFDEHKEFLMNYPGLEVLYLDGNQLTDISFAASLKKTIASLRLLSPGVAKHSCPFLKASSPFVLNIFISS